MGIPTNRYILGAFAICGALSGLAGAIQATGFHHKLVPSISGGYGFLGILVVLLAGFRAIWIAPIAAFFAVIAVGSITLTLRLDVDSALGAVITGILVLFALMASGLRSYRRRKRSLELPPDPEESTSTPTPARGGAS
jgi:simple sugar transport system permease protein